MQEPSEMTSEKVLYAGTFGDDIGEGSAGIGTLYSFSAFSKRCLQYH
jgi:hypothetical protein